MSDFINKTPKQNSTVCPKHKWKKKSDLKHILRREKETKERQSQLIDRNLEPKVSDIGIFADLISKRYRFQS